LASVSIFFIVATSLTYAAIYAYAYVLAFAFLTNSFQLWASFVCSWWKFQVEGSSKAKKHVYNAYYYIEDYDGA